MKKLIKKIKQKYFRFKLKIAIEQSNKLLFKGLLLNLNLIECIGYPRNEKEKEILKDSIEKCDLYLESAKTQIKYSRMYLED